MKILLEKDTLLGKGPPNWTWTVCYAGKRVLSPNYFVSRAAAWNDLRKILNADKVEIKTVIC